MTAAAVAVFAVGFILGMVAGAVAFRRYRDDEVGDLRAKLARLVRLVDHLRTDALQRLVDGSSNGLDSWK